VQRQPKEPTARELGEQQMAAGPQAQQKAWKQSGVFLAKAKAGAQRVNVEPKLNYAGVKPVNQGEFQSEFKKAGTARQESGLPEAFLALTTAISPTVIRMSSDRTFDTNVVVEMDGTGKGGKVWVSEVSLVWVVNAAGFLNVSVIDPSMLSPIRKHEVGHKQIAESIQIDLAKRMTAELDQLLPSEKNPIQKNGKNWGQEGVNAISRQIDRITNRYLNWWDELAAKADSAWDSQEQKTLSRIAQARVRVHQGRVPTVPGED
jgi:hypothetical protein